MGEIEITADPSGGWREVSTEVTPVSGRAAIFFKFVSDSPDQTACDLLSFRFEKK